MEKNYFRFILLISFLFANQMIAQQRNLWRKAELNSLDVAISKDLEAKNYQAFELELSELKKHLSQGKETLIISQPPKIKVEFPLKNGQLVSYWVSETSVLHPDLAQKYPSIKSYSGKAVEDPSIKINFSVNDLGFHAMIINGQGKVQYIDPLKTRNQTNKKFYQVYDRGDIRKEKQAFHCELGQVELSLKKQATSLKSFDSKLRTYQLALAATGEYSQFHIKDQNAEGATEAQKRAIVFSAMETAMNRINMLFLNDLAIMMQLTTDQLIYLDPNTDPYTNSDRSSMLDENQRNCDQVLGADNYDIGHVFSTNPKGGATKALGIVCKDGLKAKSVTGLTLPIGDEFYIDYAAHEFGHQFGANHTFSGNASICGGDNNTNSATAVEPGSGSTIMAYADLLCESQNVQADSDLYFHSVSIQEIWNTISATPETCAKMTDIAANRHRPTADAGPDFTIPKGTPFKLVGAGQDGDGDPLSYCWEQIDNQISRFPPNENNKIGPLYRSHPPKESPIRYLPDLSALRSGAVSSTWEVTPQVGRELNFSLTVRDNNEEAGQVAIDQLKVQVSETAGPFLVTSQNSSGLIWEPNSEQTVEWEVAGTNANGINVSKVNILLSNDGGNTYTIPLATNTSNDGMETIIIPNTRSKSCYIMVEAVDHYFFAINQKPFSIGECEDYTQYIASENLPMNIPDNDPQGIVSSIEIDEALYIEDISISVTLEHSWLYDLSLELESPDGYMIQLLKDACQSEDGIDAVFTDAGESLSCYTTDPSIRGEVLPNEPLLSLATSSSKGLWALRVVDSEGGDTGRLISWGINFCGTQEVLASKEFSLKGFNLFPNPAKGSFQLSFETKTEKVAILMYDALGRTVLQKSYQNKGFKFEERIKTTQLKSGLYFLKVVNGDAVVTERVLIQ